MKTTVATKFVAWEVPNLENLQDSKVYGLRIKLNNGEKLSREEKDWLTREVNSNTYFKSAVPLQGWRFDFSDILRTFIVNQYGRWTEYKATDKTGLRRFLYGRINSIVELKKR
ncbi:molybdenum ABC transporter ATP-binding protein [Parabacteroides timonensis]|uniref:molybdenum ABC transporter ATP-binding protein n=1 Tax=Parabacteroides timonensis TaxID=1871013 RepID=UPI00094F2837|nr:molybdenum ABC transporter ATP-binding protein [Parabacteroides timonensis]